MSSTTVTFLEDVSVYGSAIPLDDGLISVIFANSQKGSLTSQCHHFVETYMV